MYESELAVYREEKKKCRRKVRERDSSVPVPTFFLHSHSTCYSVTFHGHSFLFGKRKGYVRDAHTFIASFAFEVFAMVTDSWMERMGREEEREEKKRTREEQAEWK